MSGKYNVSQDTIRVSINNVEKELADCDNRLDKLDNLKNEIISIGRLVEQSKYNLVGYSDMQKDLNDLYNQVMERIKDKKAIIGKTKHYYDTTINEIRIKLDNASSFKEMLDVYSLLHTAMLKLDSSALKIEDKIRYKKSLNKLLTDLIKKSNQNHYLGENNMKLGTGWYLMIQEAAQQLNDANTIYECKSVLARIKDDIDYTNIKSPEQKQEILRELNSLKYDAEDKLTRIENNALVEACKKEIKSLQKTASDGNIVVKKKCLKLIPSAKRKIEQTRLNTSQKQNIFSLLDKLENEIKSQIKAVIASGDDESAK